MKPRQLAVLVQVTSGQNRDLVRKVIEQALIVRSDFTGVEVGRPNVVPGRPKNKRKATRK